MARRALGTGGNHGIGRAIAEGLIAMELDVTIAALHEEAESAIWLATLPDDGPTRAFYRDRMGISW